MDGVNIQNPSPNPNEKMDAPRLALHRKIALALAVYTRETHGKCLVERIGLRRTVILDGLGDPQSVTYDIQTELCVPGKKDAPGKTEGGPRGPVLGMS